MNKVTLLLGSNLGDKKDNLERAILFIKEKIGDITKKSFLLESVPEGYQSPNSYFNVGVNVTTALSPYKLLKEIKIIEKSMGRLYDSSFFDGEYEDRIIDIDIVYYNQLNFKSRQLFLPHQLHISPTRKFSTKILLQLK